MSEKTLSPISENEQMVLDFIQRYFKLNQLGPSIREISRATQIKSNGHITFLLNKLQTRQLITRKPFVARSIRPLDT
jgi:SOS-response transcriptional repressor LexA